MNFRSLGIIVCATALLACSLNKKKPGASTPLGRQPLVNKPLEGTVFLVDDPFTVVSGYAYAPKIGGGTIKLFDRTVKPCRKMDALGNGRMIQINIPEDAVKFYFESKEDSKEVGGSVIFEDSDRSRPATGAEFERRKWSEDSVTGALFAGDGDGSMVNGTFTVKRCGDSPNDKSATSTSDEQATDTDSEEGSALHAVPK